MKKYAIICLTAAATLGGCNSINYVSNSIDTTQTIYADRGGYGMRRSVKYAMAERGYNIVVGTAKSSRDFDAESINIDSSSVPDNARYVVKVSERNEKFNPFWCPFNGFWWWNFNMSIADQKTGREIMSWRGRGCANSSLRKLNKFLDEMEI